MHSAAGELPLVSAATASHEDAFAPPHIGDNYLKGVMLDQYNTANRQVLAMAAEIDHLGDAIRAAVRGQRMQEALASNRQRNLRQVDMEAIMEKRDAALTHVILVDPKVAAKFDAFHDTAHPAYRAPGSMDTPASRRHVDDQHRQSDAVEAQIQTLLTQYVHVQGEMEAALAQHDIQSMERLQSDIDELDGQLQTLDARRGAAFVEISLWNAHVRHLVKQFRDEQQRGHEE
ncbi:Aste57867_1874 [Aphanomyces stellatus]|uniref:Aste57867_1874 protein n=1 Tax=Aphanomyces stellatus TaxID=120398 RepID=A0A485KAI6_9STRA|nr:hypothetical protein As57867_001872 [Aphanomyces stellatus]VFT79081.1 Aste57867_1874 [Aphanomyces stellatus]